MKDRFNKKEYDDQERYVYQMKSMMTKTDILAARITSVLLSICLTDWLANNFIISILVPDDTDHLVQTWNDYK